MHKKLISFFILFFILTQLGTTSMIELGTTDDIIQENLDDFVQVDTLRGNSSIEVFSPTENLPQGLQPQQSISETWNEGESIHLEYSFDNSSVSSFDDGLYHRYTSPPIAYPSDMEILYYGSLSFLHTNPANAFVQVVTDDPSNETYEYVGATLILNIPAFTTGTLHYKYTLFIIDDSSGYQTLVTVDSTYAVGTEDLSTDGFFRGQFVYWAVDAATKDYTVTLYQTSGDYAAIATTVSTHTRSSIQSCQLWVYSFFYVRDSLTDDVRCEYQYTSPDIRNIRIPIQSFEYNTEIKVYTPNYMEYATISPDATVTENSGYYSLTNTVPVNYDFYCHTNTSKQYLAISDKTSDYWSDIGFEGSFRNDWSDGSNLYETINLDSSIVLDGAYSLYMKNSAGYGQIQADLNAGYFYVSVNIYRISGTSIVLNYYTDGGWVGLDLDTGSSTNRWYRKKFFIHLDNSSHINLVIQDGNGGNFEGYLDNFQIWEVNHEVETSGYRRIKVKGQTISWDQYSCNGVSYEDIELAAYDRTAGTEITSTTVTTDNNGYWEWIIYTSSYSELQDQREIEIRSWSYNSWFGSPDLNYDLTEDNDLADFLGGGWTSGSESMSSDAHSGSLSYQFEGIDTVDADQDVRQGGNSPDWDFSNCDYFICWFKTNVSLLNVDAYVNTDGVGFFFFDTNYDVTANSWTLLTFEFGTEDTSAGDLADVDVLRIDSDVQNTALKINFDEARGVQAQKSYFTSLPATDFFYYYETDPNNNEFDYSEETTEGWVNAAVGVTVTLVANDGHLNASMGSTINYGNIKKTGLSIDSDEYSKAFIRIKGNENNIRFAFSDGTNTLMNYQVVTTSYQEFTVTLDSDWSGTETIFGISFAEESGQGNFEGTEIYYIDTIRLIHRDTPLLSVVDSYGYLSSSNNSFEYRVEIDDVVQGYHEDLISFSTDQTVGSHTINATVWDDTSRSGLVFLPGSSVTSSYTVAAIAFSVEVGSYYLSDSYVNIYVTATKDCSYTIYENDSSSGSGNVDKDGTAISHSRTTTYGSFIELAYKFVNSTDTVWFNTSYSNSAYTQLIITISTPILVDGRISLAVTSNLGGAEIYINDDSKVGVEVNWESEGVFSWYSNTIGENNITIQAKKDCNGDSDTSDTGETFSDTVAYHLYNNDLEVHYSYILPYASEGTSYVFSTNYRGSASAEFRAKTQDQLGWSGWLSEDTQNGTYDFTFVNCDLDTTYNFSVEIRVYVTDESPGYQYFYDRIEYTPYSPDAIISNPQGIHIPENTTLPVVDENYLEIGVQSKSEFLSIMIGFTLILVGSFAVILFGTIFYLTKRLPDEGVMETFTRIATEKTMETSDKITSDMMGILPGGKQ